MTILPEPADAPTFRFKCIDGERVIVASTRMCNVIDAATYCSIVPFINDVKRQGNIYPYSREQSRGRIPCLVANTGHKLTSRRCSTQWYRLSLTCDNISLRI